MTKHPSFAQTTFAAFARFFADTFDHDRRPPNPRMFVGGRLRRKDIRHRHGLKGAIVVAVSVCAQANLARVPLEQFVVGDFAEKATACIFLRMNHS